MHTNRIISAPHSYYASSCDLDILYILGDWNEAEHNPSEILKALKEQIDSDYENPTSYKMDISLQTHSVTISYSKDEKEVMSVDIVPGYIFSKK